MEAEKKNEAGKGGWERIITSVHVCAGCCTPWDDQ